VTYFADLAPCDYFPIESAGKLLAVGWLGQVNEYARAAVNPQFFAKLVELTIDPWQPCASAGVHRCEFCRFSGGPSSVRYGTTEVQIGISNVFVPADGFVLVAPSMILHYIDAHGYAPPEVFQQAVMGCPSMRSIDYLKALLKNGPPGLTRSTQSRTT
jgi:hypothetical protein